MPPTPGDLVTIHGSSYDSTPIGVGILLFTEEETVTTLGEIDRFFIHTLLTQNGIQRGYWYLRILQQS